MWHQYQQYGLTMPIIPDDFHIDAQLTEKHYFKLCDGGMIILSDESWTGSKQLPRSFEAPW